MHLIMDRLLISFFQALLVMLICTFYSLPGYAQLSGSDDQFSATDDQIENFKQFYPDASREELIEIIEGLNKRALDQGVRFMERRMGESVMAQHLIDKPLFEKLRNNHNNVWQSIEEGGYNEDQIEKEIKKIVLENSVVKLYKKPHRYCIGRDCYSAIDFEISNNLFSHSVLLDIKYSVKEVVGDDGKNYVGLTDWLDGNPFRDNSYDVDVNFINGISLNSLKFARFDLLLSKR